MYKVFFNDRILHLANRFPKEDYDAYDIVMHYRNMESLRKAIENFENTDTRKALIYFNDENFLFKQFASHFSLVKAAGGVVTNPDEQVLLIFRRGKWDLPKGKNESGESLEETALREVSEETNLKELTLGDFITDTYHTYYVGTNAILKQTRWFFLRNEGNGNLIPQVKEDITHVLWVPTEDLNKYTQNTYGSIIEVLQKAGKIKHV